MLSVFAWKALPRPEAPRLIALTSAFVVVFFFLQLRRRYDQTLSLISFFKWLMFLGGVSFAALAFYAWGQNRTLLSRQLHLQKVQLQNQDLSALTLTGANTHRRESHRRDLTEANLTGANLTITYLVGARLYGANLTNAILNGTFLNDADLTGAILTQQQVNAAFGNQKTTLPTGLKTPPKWHRP